MYYILVAVLSLAFGIYCPSLARKIHAVLSKEAAKGVTLVEGDLKDAEQDIKKKL